MKSKFQILSTFLIFQFVIFIGLPLLTMFFVFLTPDKLLFPSSPVDLFDPVTPAFYQRLNALSILLFLRLKYRIALLTKYSLITSKAF